MECCVGKRAQGVNMAGLQSVRLLQRRKGFGMAGVAHVDDAEQEPGIEYAGCQPGGLGEAVAGAMEIAACGLCAP